MQQTISLFDLFILTFPVIYLYVWAYPEITGCPGFLASGEHLLYLMEKSTIKRNNLAILLKFFETTVLRHYHLIIWLVQVIKGLMLLLEQIYGSHEYQKFILMLTDLISCSVRVRCF